MMRMDAIRRRSLMRKKTNHTVLNYLKSDGNQWVDTGIYFSSGMTVGVEFSAVNGTTTQYINGSRYSAGASTPMFGMRVASSVLNMGLYSVFSNVMSFLQSTWYHWKQVDRQSYVDGVLKATSSATTQFTTTNTIGVFACKVSDTAIFTGYGFNGYIRRHYIIASDGVTYLQDLEPVIKDGIYCMHDKITDTYFYNKGTGSFTGG